MYSDVKLDPHTFEQKTGDSSREYSLDIILIKNFQSVCQALPTLYTESCSSINTFS